MLNAIACFGLVLTYLFAGALPTHNTPKWSSGITYADNIQFPGIALTFANAIAAPVKIFEMACETFHVDNPILVSCHKFLRSKTHRLRVVVTGYSTPLLRLLLSAHRPARMINYTSITGCNVSTTIDLCRHLLICADDGPPIHSSCSDTDLLLWEVVFFDSRLGLLETVQCDLDTFASVDSLSSPTFTVTPRLTTDTLGLIKIPIQKRTSHNSCPDVYRSAFSTDPPYTSYAQASSLYGTGHVLNNCTSTSANNPKGWLATMTFSWRSLAAKTMESVPGNEELDIWLNAGAIVGAVQLFAWFLGMFNT
jgi:hypothetical protein